MIAKNAEGLRIANIRSAIHPSQLTRAIPVLENNNKRRNQMIESFGRNYAKFIDSVRTSDEVVDYVEKMWDRRGLTEEEGFFYKNREGTAFAMIRYGENPVENGVKILFSHCDSPCLKLKSKPLLLEWDPDLQPLHTGLELDTFAYGGVIPHQWTGRTLEVRGYMMKEGVKKKIRFPVYSPEICQHTDDRRETGVSFSEAHLEEKIDLITGNKSAKEFLERRGLKEEHNFSRSALFVYPIVRANFLENGYLSGYGHDARTGIYSSVRALIDIKKPAHTSITIGFDKEEIGSLGEGGANGKFFDAILGETLIGCKKVKSLEEITGGMKDSLLSKSTAIDTDIEMAATHLDEDPTRIDRRNIPLFGYGCFVSTADGIFEGDQTSPSVVDYVMNVFKNRNIQFQPCGSPLVSDNAMGFASFNKYLSERGIDTINVGVPTGSTHSPEELINIGDLYCAYEANRAILEEK